MKAGLPTIALTVSLFGCGCAFGQVGSANPSPLLATPLTIGPSVDTSVGTGVGTSVGPAGIPLGATELAAPGISPGPSVGTACTTAGADATPTSTFDGGGMAGAPSSACASADNGVATLTTTPALGSRGTGIPLGSTEIASPGLSPLPSLTTPFVSQLGPSATATPTSISVAPAPAATPCPIVGAFTDQSTVRGAATASSGVGTGAPGC
jgi:hypothetical protein